MENSRFSSNIHLLMVTKARSERHHCHVSCKFLRMELKRIIIKPFVAKFKAVASQLVSFNAKVGLSMSDTEDTDLTDRGSHVCQAKWLKSK